MSGIKITPRPIMPTFPPAEAGKIAEAKESSDSFGDFLSNALKGVNDLEADAAEAQDKLVRGEAAELHQVMIAAEKAGISFDLLLEVRRKLLEAYQQIMQMPV